MGVQTQGWPAPSSHPPHSIIRACCLLFGTLKLLSLALQAMHEAPDADSTSNIQLAPHDPGATVPHIPRAIKEGHAACSIAPTQESVLAHGRLREGLPDAESSCDTLRRTESWRRPRPTTP